MREKFLLNILLLSIALCTVAAISSVAQPVVADAGPPTAEVCEGDGLVLGGSPTA